MPAGYNCSMAENKGGGGAQDRRHEGVLLQKTPRLPAPAGLLSKPLPSPLLMSCVFFPRISSSQPEPTRSLHFVFLAQTAPPPSLATSSNSSSVTWEVKEGDQGYK